jgi:Ni,Fe-hydrogenase maturation factor
VFFQSFFINFNEKSNMAHPINPKQTLFYAFGTENDPIAWEAAEAIEKESPGIRFIKTDNPDALAGAGLKACNLVILDAVRGIEKPTLLSIDNLKDRKAITAHDIDLGTILQLMEKTGRFKDINVRIIGIPMKSEVDTELVKNIMQIYANTKRIKQT